jgi:hypothetical protein
MRSNAKQPKLMLFVYIRYPPKKYTSRILVMSNWKWYNMRDFFETFRIVVHGVFQKKIIKK